MSQKPRTQQSREAVEIHESYDDNWESPALLDTKNIPAREGYVQRWVRTKIKGEDDQNNVFRSINAGWKPRGLDSVPKGKFVPNIDFQGSNVIGIHGMILMERPKALHEKNADYVRKQTQNQLTAVKENMFKVHKEGSGMTQPSMSNRSDVTRGRIANPDD